MATEWWCFLRRAHSTVRSRSFFVSSSGLNHTTELGLMSIITNSQPSPWNHGPLFSAGLLVVSLTH